MKTLQQLEAEYEAILEKDDIPSKEEWMGQQMLAKLQTLGSNVKPQLLQQYMFNWQLRLHEYIINLLVPEEVVDETIDAFRQFAAFSHMAAQYSALQQSMDTKKLVVPR